MGRLATALLGISDAEVAFTRRGFRGADEPPRAHLERVGRAFVAGYTAALAENRLAALSLRLEGMEAELSGFAYEGAAMAFTLLDFLQPWRAPRLPAYLEGPAARYPHLAHVGVGWALARLPGGLDRPLARLHPVYRWLALDGYGFHQGFFRWPQAVSRREVPPRVRGYGRRAFDQGLGRSLWFVEGAGVARIAATIASFPAARRGDLWSGAGLACAYAGGISEAAIEAFREAAGSHLPEAAQGAAFAATAKNLAGHASVATDLACRVLCEMPAAAAARLAEEAGEDLPESTPAEPSYEAWRRRLQDHFRPEGKDRCSPREAFSAAMR